jgi:antirestriction protein ArdC
VLWATADAAGYGPGLWATYKQWGEMGGQVRKGEQGTPVVYWKITKPSERGDTDGEDEAGGGKRVWMRFDTNAVGAEEKDIARRMWG